MNKTFFAAVLSAGLLLACSQSPLVPQGADSRQPGVLDLRSWDFKAHPTVSLDGVWAFWWGQLVDPVQAAADQPPAGRTWQKVPDIWNDYQVNGVSAGALGAATYHIRLLLPESLDAPALKVQTIGSAYRFYINGELVSQGGTVSLDSHVGKAGYHPGLIFLRDKSRVIDVVVQVSNYNHIEGGLWYSTILGPVESVSNLRQGLFLVDMFLLGSLIIMGIYNVGLWFFLRRDFSPLYFGLLALLLSIRILVYGEYYILEIWPDLDWQWLQKIGYFTLYFGPPLFFHFIRSLFPAEMRSWIVRGIDVVIGVFAVLTLFTDYLVYAQFLRIYQVFMISCAVYMIWVLFVALKHRRKGAGFFLLGFFFLFLTLINDVLYTNLIIRTGHLVPLGIFIFIVFQSLVLTSKFSQAFFEVDKLSKNLMEFNSSLSRFVPTEFLDNLGKQSILEIQIGDHVQKRMAVLFSDIRSFTALSERLTPEENFRFINSFLKRMGPPIRANKGFVDKYMGDGIMALFPESADHAVLAALSMCEALAEYNLHRSRTGYQPIQIGIGIHFGKLMMGTIGENQRMDSTVISDAVNLASRLENLTKIYGASIIASLDVMTNLSETVRIESRFLGFLQVKGKDLPIPAYEIFHADEITLRQFKLATKADFESALSLLQDRKFAGAYKIFRRLYRENPLDKGVEHYYQKLRSALKAKAGRKKDSAG